MAYLWPTYGILYTIPRNTNTNTKKRYNKRNNMYYIGEHFVMNKRDFIIQEMYLSTDINDAIGKMNPIDLQDDLRQEVFLVLCEMDEEKLFEMYDGGYLKYFIVRTILNMAKSDRSNFYKKFRQVYQEIPLTYEVKKEDYDEGLMNKLEKGLEVLHWYEAELLKLYANNGKNLLAISRETKIPYRSLIKTIRKAKILMKYKIRNYADN
jgi:hypothetical protein